MIRKLKTERLIFLICILICLLALVISTEAYERKLTKLEYQNMKQAAQLKDKQEQIEILEIIIENQKTEPEVIDEPEYIGTFEITYYTAGPESTGKSPDHPEYGITRSGTEVEEGRTIAADWGVLEPGTKVFIEGIGERIVEDTGGLIVDKCIDVYVEDVDVALQGGRHKADVWIVEDIGL